MVALMGRNGMGKTTTIRSIMGLTPARSGAIRFAGRGCAAFPSFRDRAARHRPGAGRPPDISEPDRARKSRRRRRQSRGNPRSLDARKDPRAVSAARRARRNMGNTLSGGEQQMLAIGRALMTNPRLLILDEATEGLAPLIREEIWNCLSMLKARGQSVLVIDKNVEQLTRIADRHYIIERGRVVWSGTSEQLIAEPDLQHRYLGI
jgi:branched-chain amino acid transport system ATP-binding protein